MIPLHLRDGAIWLDGRHVAWPEARLHVLSHGLHYGTAAFEGVRVYDGRPFKLREHCERLAYSCRTVGIALPYGVDQLVAEIEAYAEACRFGDAYIRPIAWRGADELGIVGRSGDCHLAVAGWEWSGPHPDAAEAGLSLGLGPWRRPAPTMWPLQAKLSGLYAIGSMNAAAARAEGFDDALVCAPDGEHVAELTGANIFFVRDGGLVTPPADSALDGLTRQEIVALASALSIRVEIAKVPLAGVAAFDGAFATGTAYEVVPVARIGAHRYDLGSRDLRRVLGPLRDAYRERTRGRMSSPGCSAASRASFSSS